MQATSYGQTEPSQMLPVHAAMIPAATRLDGAPHKGWYFTILVRAAYLRLEGTA